MEKIYSKLAVEKSREIRTIQSEIEMRTKGDVFVLLGRYGLGKIRKYRWKDYKMAKKICFEGLFIDSIIYDKQIGWICDFLKL